MYKLKISRTYQVSKNKSKVYRFEFTFNDKKPAIIARDLLDSTKHGYDLKVVTYTPEEEVK